LKETQPLWPPQQGVGLREPNLGKTNPRVSLHYSLTICFAPSLSWTLFLTLTRLVVVIIFENFSFALFTPPPLGDFQLCKLEKIFPPGFFNSMEHLLIHIPYEAKVGGPVQYRWMYHIERALKNLRGMIRNKARVEGCIAEAFLLKKVSYFTSVYFARGT
jgi:hypothetical protein